MDLEDARPTARWSLGVLLLAISLAACSSQDASESLPAPTGSDASWLYPASDIQLRADPRAVLADLDGEPALTVAEFNDRLGEFPIEKRVGTVEEARKVVLDRMLDHKLIAREGRRLRSEAGLPEMQDGHPYQIERTLAFYVIRENVSNPLAISDEEARKYRADHAGSFGYLDSSDAPEDQKLMSVKTTMLSDRFQEKVRSWRDRTHIEVVEDLLKD